MASRSSSSMGVMVALVIFILLSLGFLLSTMLAYTKMEQKRTELEKVQDDLKAYVDSRERERDDIKSLAREARNANKSVVGYLNDETRQMMRLVANNPDMNSAALENRMRSLGLAEGDIILSTLTQYMQDLNAEQDRTEQLENLLQTTRDRMEAEVTRREQLEQDHQAAIASLQAEIDRIQQRSDEYARRVGDAEQSMDNRVSDIRDRYEVQVTDLDTELDSERGKVAELTGAITELRDRIQGITLSDLDEAVLPDGHVRDFGERDTVYIDLGREDHVVLGMTFEIYGSTADLRKDSSGRVPAGKATIEVTRVSDTMSTARIIRTTSGRAVVAGDIIVNPIYDRNKQYTCFVFGQFDTDGEGGPSALETEDVVSRIQQWGGAIVDEFRGDVDYLVLGQAPTIPIEPPANAPPWRIRQYIAEKTFYKTYQDYLAQAGNLSIPVLNQNRLFTLIGYYAP